METSIVFAFISIIVAARGFSIYETTAEVGLGESCNSTVTCIDNAKCAYESADPVCKCDDQYVPSNDLESCIKKVELGLECLESTQCPIGARCMEGKSKKYCTCRDDFVPNYDENSCLQKVTLGQSCLESSQCVFQAECSRDPWGPLTCRCVDGLEPSKDNLRCVAKSVRLGDYCNSTIICEVESADCVKGICDCINGFVKNKEGDACIPKVEIGKSCTVNEQCVNHATCKSKKCTCNLGYKANDKECTKIFQIGESCVEESDQCGKFAKCTDKKCQCNEGYVPDTKSFYDCKAGLQEFCEARSDCSNPDVMMCTSNECVCKDTYEVRNNTCMGALGAICMPGGCSTNFSECNKKNKKCECIEGYQQMNSECAAPLTKPCTQSGGCSNRFAVCDARGECTCDEGYSMSSENKTCQAGFRKKCTVEDGCWDSRAKCWLNSVNQDFQCDCTSSFIYDKGSDTCKNGSGAIKSSAIYIFFVSALFILKMR